MERIKNNEEFLKKLVKAKKKDAIQLIQESSDEEYKSVVELLLNSKGLLKPKYAKKCKPVYSALKKLKNVSKKVFLCIFKKFFKQIMIIIAFMLYIVFEEGVSEVYCQPT